MFPVRKVNTIFMLDEKTGALLHYINGLCKEGGFKIAEEKELLSALSLGADTEALQSMLRCLEERRYIEVQYAEEGVYCLRPLPEGRLYFERAREDMLEGGRKRKDVFLTTLLGSFSGSLLGALVALLILFLARGI